jgi:hypothetical protein
MMVKKVVVLNMKFLNTEAIKTNAIITSNETEWIEIM